MKRPLTVGERVRCFDGGNEYVGTVTKTLSRDRLWVATDGTISMFVHRKQCRRLIKHMPKECPYCAARRHQELSKVLDGTQTDEVGAGGKTETKLDHIHAGYPGSSNEDAYYLVCPAKGCDWGKQPTPPKGDTTPKQGRRFWMTVYLHRMGSVYPDKETAERFLETGKGEVILVQEVLKPEETR